MLGAGVTQVASGEPAEEDPRSGAQRRRGHVIAVRPARRAMNRRRRALAAAASDKGNKRGHDTTPSRDQATDIEHTRRLRAERHPPHEQLRSEEHTSELQSLMRTSYTVICLKK